MVRIPAKKSLRPAHVVSSRNLLCLQTAMSIFLETIFLDKISTVALVLSAYTNMPG